MYYCVKMIIRQNTTPKQIALLISIEIDLLMGNSTQNSDKINLPQTVSS